MVTLEHLAELIQPLIALLCLGCGFGIKILISRIKSLDYSINVLRDEFREELREFQRKEICASHREYMGKRIDELYRRLLDENHTDALRKFDDSYKAKQKEL